MSNRGTEGTAGSPSEPKVPRAPHPATTASTPTKAVEACRARSAHGWLVLAPLGCWSLALVLDVASRFGADAPSLVRAGTWLTGIGLLSAVVAALAGMVVGAPIPVGTTVHRRVLVHLCLVTAVFVVYTLGFVLRLGAPTGRPATPSTVLVSALGAVVLAATAYTGRAVTSAR